MMKANLWILLTFAILVPWGSAAEPTVRQIPVALGLASHPVNGGDCFVSDGTSEYLAFYDTQHQMTVAKRKLGEETWDFATLPEKVGWDTHNCILIFLDRTGHLHVTGNMHGHPLKYYRTATPGDIYSFQGIHRWAGFKEERVTYPSLLKLRDGSIHMMYRFGGSGNGMRILVHYDEETQTWTGPGTAFISGMDEDPTCNAYPFGGIVEDAQGRLHIAWCWRQTPDVLTNFNINYAMSDDGGLTWKRSDGTGLDLPITPRNAEVVEAIPQNHGLMNGGTLLIDPQGRPYIGYTHFDAKERNQIYVATLEGTEWKVVQVSDWDIQFRFSGGGTIPQSPPIPRLGLLDGKISITYSSPLVKPSQGTTEIPREALLSSQPEDFIYKPVQSERQSIPHVRAVCGGPLPTGEIHYMSQKADQPNRDRKPENPMEPQMIYVYEVIQSE
ncbi:MAG: BNR repeat-containing protein [bacterium]|jgi:hypothetical protein|nr:BNR repeat-containing protein [bacterium]